jgi:hypothetical protein
MTQAAELTDALRRRWYTWGDLTALRISNSPWARLISEAGLQRNLRDGEYLTRRLRPDGLMEMRVQRRVSPAARNRGKA